MDGKKTEKGLGKSLNPLNNKNLEAMFKSWYQSFASAPDLGEISSVDGFWH